MSSHSRGNRALQLARSLLHPTRTGYSPDLEALLERVHPIEPVPDECPAVHANETVEEEANRECMNGLFPFLEHVRTAAAELQCPTSTVAAAAAGDAGPVMQSVTRSHQPMTDFRRSLRSRLRKLRVRQRIAVRRSRYLAEWMSQSAEQLAARYQSNPACTLFVCRLDYSTTGRQLRREMEVFGPVRSTCMVSSSSPSGAVARPKGYAFIEFEHQKDMVAAYRGASGLLLDGRRIVVDVERGRAFLRSAGVFVPRVLGGGLGLSRTELPLGSMATTSLRILRKGFRSNSSRDTHRLPSHRGGGGGPVHDRPRFQSFDRLRGPASVHGAPPSAERQMQQGMRSIARYPASSSRDRHGSWRQSNDRPRTPPGPPRSGSWGTSSGERNIEGSFAPPNAAVMQPPPLPPPPPLRPPPRSAATRESHS